MKTLSPRIRHIIIGQWVLLATLMVSTIVMYVAFERVASCQQSYMARVYEVQTARSRTADAERTSLAKVFYALASGDRAAALKAVSEHADLLRKNDKVRAENPYPELPKAC